MVSLLAMAVHLVVLGDSLAYGTGASSASTSFAGRIFQHVANAHPGSTLQNLGVPGATVAEVQRFQVHRIDRSATLVVLIAGANDVAQTRDPADFAHRYAGLLDSIATRVPNARVVAAGMPNIASARATPSFARPVLTAACATLDAMMQQQTAARGAGFFDLFALTTHASVNAGDFSPDGVHPSDRGYSAMASAAYPAIDAALGRH